MSATGSSDDSGGDQELAPSFDFHVLQLYKC